MLRSIVEISEAGLRAVSYTHLYHLVVQQLFAMLFERGLEIEEQEFLDLMRRVPGYADIIDSSWAVLSDHLIVSGYLIRTGFLLSLGPKAEHAFRGKGLADLCVSFDSPRSFAAMQGNTMLGHVDPMSLSNRKEGPVVLALGGRSWRVASVDWRRDRVYVEPADEKGASRWMGGARGVSRVIATQVRDLIEHPLAADAPVLTKRCLLYTSRCV